MPATRNSSKGRIALPKRTRNAIEAEPGDVVTLRLVDPFDLEFHATLSSTLTEWASAEDDEAYRDL